MDIQDSPDGRVALADLSYPQLEEWVASVGEARYRAEQIRQWLYVALVSDFEQMSSLPAAFRERLSQEALISSIQPVIQIQSTDGQTEKALFRLRDGQTMESVLMRYSDRQTICVSTQVGCPIGCAFCATGQGGLERDLTTGEIVDQVLHFARQLQEEGLQVTNVVLMGMGEPFLNYDATWQAIEVLHDPKGFNLGARRFTISTAGVVPGIDRLIEEELQVGLAVSLHAADNALRDTLVPLNQRYPLDVLMPACRRYAERTGSRVTFEYALMNKVNDEPDQAHALVGLLQGLPCHVNLIPLNPCPDSPYKASSRDRVVAFQMILRRANIPNSLRIKRGVDIQAGCGQLRSQETSGW